MKGLSWFLVLASVVALGFGSQARAEEEIFRIEIGRDYNKYSQSDLQRRVWELERAVRQLQMRVFQLEVTKPSAPTADTWICTISALGNQWTGTGATKAVAAAKAIESCKTSRNGDGFFCKEPKCEQ